MMKLREFRDLVRCSLELSGWYLRSQGRGSWSRVTIRSQETNKQALKKRSRAPELRHRRNEEGAAFVDGSARGGASGFAVYYAEGHALNLASAVRVGGECAKCCGDRGHHNVAEIAACYAAVLRHPRDQPLAIYTDSVAALKSVERYRDAKTFCGFPPPAPALVAALCAVLPLRTADTLLAKVPAHSGLAKNDVADALAASARDKGLVAFDVPASFLDSCRCVLESWFSRAAFRARLLAVQLGYLLRHTKTRRDVVALDCEMVGASATNAALLASVCAVDEAGDVLYFSYVRREPCTVGDYRTSISGVSASHLSPQNPRARDFDEVRAAVRHLLRNKILVGHDLRHDLDALRLHHPTNLCRDTALFFLDDNNQKRKLKHLARRHLGLRIQQRGRPHRPRDDATAALRLYLAYRDKFDANASSSSSHDSFPHRVHQLPPPRLQQHQEEPRRRHRRRHSDAPAASAATTPEEAELAALLWDNDDDPHHPPADALANKRRGSPRRSWRHHRTPPPRKTSTSPPPPVAAAYL